MHQAQVNKLEADASTEGNIRNVWVYNYEAELRAISELLDEFPFIAMVGAFTKPSFT